MDSPRLETITPARAEQYLNRNTGNRTLRSGLVEKYASDMKEGRWTECPVPISFYDNGDVADGQHRLWAIIESKTTQKFFVLRNLPRAAGLNLDTGAVRSIVDNAKISGTDPELTNDLVATARAIEDGDRQSTAYSNAKRLAIVQKHREAAAWAIQNGPKGRHIRNAVVLGALARAWYHEDDKDRLRQFAQVFGTGHVMEGESDSAAIALRNYILTRFSNGHRIHMQFRDNMLKAMNAIKYFMQRRKLMVIKTVTEEAYPLLGVKKLKKAA